ncbi:MAG TPA: cupredoxin domain-containing protein [Actinomycetota bacterium]
MRAILTQRALRLGIVLAAAALAAAACAPAEEPPNIPIQAQGQLQVQVVDQLYDAGRGVAVALQPDGTPVVSYLLYKPVLKKGDIPPPVLPGQPQPPAVIFATLSKGIWNRVSVTPQQNNPAQGDAPELANKQGQAVQGAETDVAVDAQGKHHMVWSTPNGGLFYADDTAGNFGEAEKITGSPAFGASIAVGSDGKPWVSFYAGGSLRAAQRTAPGRWKTEEVRNNAGPASASATVSAIRVASSGEPLVAFGDHGKTVVGTHSGGAWQTEQIPGGGGYGVSLALDKNGTPRVAFYDIEGNVHEAQSTGTSAWKVTDLGSTAPGAKEKSDPGWSTSIAIDDKGTTFVTWADTKAKQIVMANDQDGNFAARPVSGSTNGTNPSLAVSADGKSLALAWFDSVNANLEVAQAASGGLTIAHPTPAVPTGGATSQPTAATCEPDGTTLQISAPTGASAAGFDKSCLAAPAGKAFTIDFNNQDTGTPHNVEIFTDSSATNRLGGAKDASDFIVGPGTATYKVDTLKAGTYFFRCDIHPTVMTGTFVVK